jgi:putative addiction module killer protein
MVNIKNIEQTIEFSNWINGLRDRNARLRILSRISKIAQTGHLGDVKPLGKGLNELRFDFGPGYRVYFILRGDVVIVLIGGGDKSTQDRDISLARRYLEIN